MRPKVLSFTISILAIIISPLRAQVVADGATNTLSNVTTNIGGDVTVGTNGSFTLLVLSNNALLTNSVNGLIGRNPTAKTNEVQVLAPTARWRMGGSLFVGSNGAFSRLVVSNGALLENFNGILANNAASSNNSTFVTGVGSVWTNRGDVTVGFVGKENQLLISNGGFVVDRFGYLGRQPGSSNNFARVTGPSSVWSNQFDLFVGANDRSNRLVIEAGGQVSCANAILSGSSSAGDCEVLVTGSGSLWSNRIFLSMGDVAGRNLLVVSNGATVWAGGSIFGNLSSAVSNQGVVTGSGSLWTNQSSLSLGGSSVGNRVDVNNGGRLACVDGFVGENASSHSNSVFLSGGGSGWNNLGNLIVGNKGSANILIASNGATVLSSNATIGANVAFASNTLAWLTGAGTLWSNRADFLVGSNGSANLLVVSNGARVFAGTNAVIGVNASGSNNTVILTGPGSTWSNRNYVFVGQMGSGNRFVVSNGASADTLAVYLGTDAPSSNNEVTITGPGSIWTCPEWGVASLGKAGRLVLSNGGKVRSSFCNVGAFGGGDNLALVTDAGSSWTNEGDFFVGIGDRRNALVVSNGGVLSVQSMMVGRDPGSVSNRINVAGSTLIVTNGTATGVFEVRRGTNIFSGGYVEADQLLMTNAQGSFEFNGGTLITRSTIISNGNAFFIGLSGTNPAVWDVRAGVTNHVINHFLDVGFNIPFCQLLVTNGASLSSTFGGTIGVNAGANSNTATISGIGSTWNTKVDFGLGFSSSFNRLLINAGGLLVTSNSFLGTANPSSNNLAIVSGANSVWSNRSTMSVGYFGGGNQLVVSNGGIIASIYGTIGSEDQSSNNMVLVTGSGSLWTNLNDFYVGLSGRGNQLLVSNGGIVRGGNGVLGAATLSSNNQAFVMDPGSLWSNRMELLVGDSGSGNRLVVSKGGTLFNSAQGTIGNGSGSRSNSVLVTDTGSSWRENNGLYVGNAGSFNESVVSNGGFVSSSVVELGFQLQSSNNLALVTDAGSMWSDSDAFSVGVSGSGNRLMVSNSGVLLNGDGYLGFNGSSSNNQALVTGPGSLWINAGFLFVGYQGSRNQLVVSNGATVRSASGFLGDETSSSNNSAIVTGSGSLWSNAVALHVGFAGSSNQMLLRSGGTLIAKAGFLGSNTNANRNVATVTDPGSRWLLSSNLYVGSNGAFNRLVISNGATLQNDFGFIGGGFFSSNNTALVTGLGSLWSNASELYVGFRGSSNQLIVSGGGTLASTNGFVGVNGNSNNFVLITDPGSVWSNSTDLSVNVSSLGNRLVVSNGGFVATRGGFVGGNGFPSSNDHVLVTGTGSGLAMESGLQVGAFGGGARLVVSNGASLSSGFCLIGDSPSTNDEVVITGAGSSWTNNGTLAVGGSGLGNRLVITNGGRVVEESFDVIVGFAAASSNNLLLVDGGSLLMTNSGCTLDIRGGTNLLNAGLIEADRLLLTSPRGFFQFNGGTLRSAETTVSNGRVFTAGNGTSPATFELRGGTHFFSNNIVLSSNATLIGSGMIVGGLTVQPGGTIAPGTSIGKLVLSNSPSLQGATTMEISKSGSVLSNDQIQVAGPLTYGGSLLVTKIGPGTLTAGDRYVLFSAASYSGTFSSITLPPLPSGFIWTNKLAVEGSLEVTLPATVLTIQRSNNVLSVSWPTNASSYCLQTTFDVSPPVIWQPVTNGIVTNASAFVFSLTNNPGTPKQFFRLAFPCSTLPAPVALSIQLSNNLVTVSWPSSSFRLETAFDLSPPIPWQTLSNGVSHNGSLSAFTFTNNPALTNQFFRLAFP